MGEAGRGLGRLVGPGRDWVAQEALGGGQEAEQDKSHSGLLVDQC
jgi:hypothetical protein